MRSEKDENHDGVTFSCVKRTEHSFFKNTFFFSFFSIAMKTMEFLFPFLMFFSQRSHD